MKNRSNLIITVFVIVFVLIMKKKFGRNGQLFQIDTNISFQKKFDDYVVLELEPGDYTVNALNK